LTRVRLRDPRAPQDEAAYYRSVYPEGYQHDRWPDHIERVRASADLIERYGGQIQTAADLSCGDAMILRYVSAAVKLTDVYLGDLNGVPDRVADLTAWRRDRRALGVHTVPGALPDSLWSLPEAALPVDLLILSETLEHVPDPDGLLRQARNFATYLFVSTPVDEPVGSNNLEHYWGWGTGDIQEMLQAAGWFPMERQLLRPHSTRHLPDAYTFQMWMAVSR
jgi:hypothetical protein